MNRLQERLAGCIDDRLVHLILMPTEACNFRCTYCYEEFKLNRMQPRVVLGVKNFLALRAPDLRGLNLSWFGGEPLLALDIMEDILDHARALVRSHPLIRLVSDITTNAYTLSRNVFERLLDRGVAQYQVSLDGPREWHDRKRVLAGGRGTFDRVWTNLLGMRDVSRDFRVIVRLHVDRDNHGALPRFIAEYGQQFGKDPRFKLFCASWPGSGEATMPTCRFCGGMRPEGSSTTSALMRRHLTPERSRRWKRRYVMPRRRTRFSFEPMAG